MDPGSPFVKTLRDIGENRLLEGLLPRLPQRHDIRTGPGDDCAVTRIPGSAEDWLFTTDPVIEGRHFLPDTPARLIGRKAVARCLSDIAAMGGTPRWLLIDLVAPADTPVLRIRSLYQGINAAAKKGHLGILGGDTAEGPLLELHLTVIGSIARGRAALRSGGRPGDSVMVTGRLGGAWLAGSRHHLLFEPRLEAGRFLAEHRFATAMMDLSDGLATDLPRMLDASGCGVLLEADAIPISRAARQTSDPLKHALADGEDFELLFTVSPRKKTTLQKVWVQRFPHLPLHTIGRLRPNPSERSLRLPDGTCIPLRSDGWQHFLMEQP